MQLLFALRAVLWGLLGIRKCAGALQDARLSPVALVVAAVLSLAFFVVGIATVVRFVAGT